MPKRFQSIDMLNEKQRSQIRACSKDEKSYQTLLGIIESHQKSLENAKSEFLSVIGHELRTPLTAIQGSLALLAKEVPGPLPEKAKQMVEIAIDNSIRLRDLINYFLDLQSLESGNAELHLQPVKLKSVLEQATKNLEAFAAKRRIRIEIEEKDREVQVLADPGRLMQVVSNLLSNAVKFSPSSSIITITISQDDTMGCFAIADQGPGIPESIQPYLFDKFVRADASKDRKSGGSGLGLSICKAIVKRHGGKIGFTSTEGIGTTFQVDLPLATPHRTEEKAPRSGNAPG